MQMSMFPWKTMSMASRPGFDRTAFVDPYDTPHKDQTLVPAPTFPPFRFEARRTRIDWRVLGGVDVQNLIRDMDLDTLERIVNIIAYGDIEAEDTRHLTELNFIKIFRLAQLMVEYLLYVQDCLQGSNQWFQQDRSNMDKYLQAVRTRVRELETDLKHTKRELRRARKTIKTYETLTAINGPTAAKIGEGTTAKWSEQSTSISPAMDAVMKRELAVLSDRLSHAYEECSELRNERDELYAQIRDLDSLVRTKSAMSPERASPSRAPTIDPLILAQSQEEVQRLRSEKDVLQSEMSRLAAENSSLVDEKEQLIKMMSAGESSVPVYQAQVGELERTIAALRKELFKVNKESGLTSGEELREANRARDMLAQRVRELEDERARTRMEPKAGDGGKELREATRARDALALQVQDLREELERVRMDAKNVEQDGEAAHMQLADANERIAELESKLKEAGSGGGGWAAAPQPRADVREITRDRDALARKVVDLEEEVDRLKRDAYTMEDELQASKKEAAQLQAKIRSMPAAAQSAPSQGPDVSQLLAKIADLESRNKTFKKSFEQAAGERDNLLLEVQELRSELERAQQYTRPSPQQGPDPALRHFQDENQGLRQALEERDRLIESLRDHIRQQQAQLNAYAAVAQPVPDNMGRVKQTVMEYERKAVIATAAPTSLQPTQEEPTTASFHFTNTPAQQPEPAPVQRPPPLAESPSPSAGTPAMSKASSLSRLSPSPALQRQQQPFTQEIEAAETEEATPTTTQRPSLAPSSTRLDSQSIRHEGMRPLLSRVSNMSQVELQAFMQQDAQSMTEMLPEGSSYMAEFRNVMRHAMMEVKGVLSVEPHMVADLQQGRQGLKEWLEQEVTEEMKQYGVDPSYPQLTDLEYAAAMKELNIRRAQRFAGQSPELAEQFTRFRKALFAHLESETQGERQMQLMMGGTPQSSAPLTPRGQSTPYTPSTPYAESSLTDPVSFDPSHRPPLYPQSSGAMLAEPPLSLAPQKTGSLKGTSSVTGREQSGMYSATQSRPGSQTSTMSRETGRMESYGLTESLPQNQFRVTPVSAPPAPALLHPAVEALRAETQYSQSQSTSSSPAKSANSGLNTSLRGQYVQSDFADDDDEDDQSDDGRHITKSSAQVSRDEYDIDEDEEEIDNTVVGESLAHFQPQRRSIDPETQRSSLQSSFPSSGSNFGVPPRPPFRPGLESQSSGPTQVTPMKAKPGPVAASGWGAEPLEKASAYVEPQPVEVEEEGVESFNNTSSHLSSVAQPHAWGTPNASIIKPRNSGSGMAGLVEVTEMASIQSFSPQSTLSTSMKPIQARPGAWGSSMENVIRPMRTSAAPVADNNKSRMSASVTETMAMAMEDFDEDEEDYRPRSSRATFTKPPPPLPVQQSRGPTTFRRQTIPDDDFDIESVEDFDDE